MFKSGKLDATKLNQNVSLHLANNSNIEVPYCSIGGFAILMGIVFLVFQLYAPRPNLLDKKHKG